MTSRDFAFWLQGFFEITEAAQDPSNHSEGFFLTPAQTEMIKRHLNLVFKHEIEPSMNLNDEEKKIHDGTDHGPFDWGKWNPPLTSPLPGSPFGPTIYC